MWSKALAVFLVGCVGMSSITACKNQSSGVSEKEQTKNEKKEEDDITLRVCWWGNQTRNDGTVKALDMYTAEHPNIKFEVEFSDYSGYWDKMSTQAAGGSLPDIVQMGYAYIEQYSDKEQILSLNSYIEDGTIQTDNIPENIIESGKIDGNVYGISAGSQAKALLVNMDAVKEAGVTLSEQPTYEEFFEVAQTVYEKTGMQYVIPSNDIETMLFLARAYGQTIYNEDNTALGMDKKIVQEYFRMLKETLDSGSHVSPERMAEASTNKESMFAAGEVWCEWTTSNLVTNTISQCPDDMNYKIFMYPTEKDATQQPLFIKPSMFWSIAATSEHPEIAADVINFLTNSEEANAQALKGERGVPISTEVAKAIEPKLDKITAMANEYVSKVSLEATPIDPPYPSINNEICTLINDFSDMVRYGEIAPDKAAEEFYNQANALLKKQTEKE